MHFLESGRMNSYGAFLVITHRVRDLFVHPVQAVVLLHLLLELVNAARHLVVVRIQARVGEDLVGFGSQQIVTLVTFEFPKLVALKWRKRVKICSESVPPPSSPSVSTSDCRSMTPPPMVRASVAAMATRRTRAARDHRIPGYFGVCEKKHHDHLHVHWQTQRAQKSNSLHILQ